MAIATDPIKDAFARAKSRLALVHRLPPSPGGLELWAVGSSTNPDAGYVVSVHGTTYTCTCPSETRPACWHRASVAIRRANDRARAEHLARSAGLMDAAPRRLPPTEEGAPPPKPVPNVVALARAAEARRAAAQGAR